MPGRSPHRRLPSPGLHVPQGSRLRSPHHHLEMPSTSRGRDHREYRSNRRSRSPPIKRRSYSPPLKRKASPSSREKEMSRRRKISKSPVGTSGVSSHAPFSGSTSNPDSHSLHAAGGSERFREKNEFEREKEIPVYRGPDEPIDYSIEELKKFTIEIVRNPPSSSNDPSINRAITNPEEIVPVRRPGTRASGSKKKKRKKKSPANEGSRPLFKKAEIAVSSQKDKVTDEHIRIISVDSSRTFGHDREHSHERTRHSPGYYEDKKRLYYSERREHSPYDSRHRSPPRHHEYVESRGKIRDRRCSREEMRRDSDSRRREDKRYSLERRRSYERDSGPRTRSVEKRNEGHPRLEEREHSSRRYDSERDKHPRLHHSPSREKRSSRSHHSPPREKRRTGSMDRHRSRSGRGEGYERDRDGGSDRRRHVSSREREDRDRNRDDNRKSHPHSSKSDAESRHDSEVVEYVPPPMVGRGLPPMPRGIIPLMMPMGRGMPRGMPRGFRPPPPMMFPMGGMMPRMPMPFMPMRGFPPRFFPPPF